MKKYTFEDDINEGYEILVPEDVTRQIIDDYRLKTFYLAVGMLSFVVGLLLGILIS